MSAPILVAAEMDAFATAYYEADRRAAGSAQEWAKFHPELYRLLDPARQRFIALTDSEDDEDTEIAEEFRHNLNDFVRKYGFLAQIVPYQDAELERLHLYGRFLLNRLPPRASGGVDIGEVDLSHLRVEKTGERDMSLTSEGTARLDGFSDGSGPGQQPDKSPLSELIEKFNTRFGTEFTQLDILPAYNATVEDPKVRAAAFANDEANFGIVFDERFRSNMVEHFSTMEDLGERYFAHNSDFRSQLDEAARKAAWRAIRREENIFD